mmetsp:Transcript_16370/g.33076  ORF Transcript_16370/g.33076 Transcript_16370/m.33076 type:complete len:215 (+) Transcript_16370:748-1392(+)
MRKRIQDGREDLDVPEDRLRLGVKLLGVLMDRGHRGIGFDGGVGVAVERMRQDLPGLGSQRARLLGLGHLDLRLNRLNVRSLRGRVLFLGKLVVDGLLHLLVQRVCEGRDDNADPQREPQAHVGVGLGLTAHKPADPFGLSNGLAVRVLALGTHLLGDALGEDEECVDEDGEADQDRVEDDGLGERVGAAQDEGAHAEEEQHREDGREYRREDP